MTGAQHKIVGIGFGIAGAMITTKCLGDPYGILVLPASAVGCMLPDIDHDRTKIGRQRKMFSDLTTNVINFMILVGVAGGAILALVTLLGFKNYGLSVNQLLAVAIGSLIFAVARKTVMNSKTFRWATKHRGLMHTLVVPIILYVAMGVSDFPLWRYTFMGLMIGYCSHLFADMLTVEGCPILFPLSKSNIRLLRLRTKNTSCTYASWLVAGLAVLLGWYVSGGV